MTLPFADVLAAIKPRERAVRIVVDGHLLAEREELAARVAAFDVSSLAGDPELPAMASRLAELDQQMEAASITFRLRALSRNAYRRLVAEHPSDDRLWDLETFPPALVAACSLDPAMTPADVNQLVEALSPGQFDMIFTAAFQACNQADGAPFNAPA